uniref:Bifunctional phosphoglucose/phosphomannose isomerase (Pgi-pmi) n=2 Tax=environmental samples TaxID=68359 RepID=A0A075G801_9EURY|nr:bifunctional phosphoglucose/phosphomannose isomerase (pgi-pmi) [uncultured marine group II/III euryarchaeote KM3_110_C01]AIF01987.1 bifunctional phosphoglucose/phosphomannose isomerase (pgi-pmi) [uncultured marine group II/III euryarchaeote KM3_152_H07]
MAHFGALFAAATAASDGAHPLAASSVIVSGMGGSGITGRLAQALAERCGGLRVRAWSDYGLPAWADGNERLIAVSYSGNTAETLSGVERAIELGCKWEAITTGGRLGALAREHGAPVTTVEPGHQPRAALPLLLVPLLRRLPITGIAAQLAEAGEVLGATGENADAASPTAIASQLAGKLPFIYGAGGLATVAYRWRCQFAENAKQLAVHHALPELDHNEIVGWAAPPPNAAVVALREPEEPARVAARWKATRAAAWRDVPVIECRARGESPLARWLSLVQLGDTVSVELAHLNGVEPTPVAVIEELKRRLEE